MRKQHASRRTALGAILFGVVALSTQPALGAPTAVPLKDIRPGATGSALLGLTNVNGTLFFSANDGTHGAELWKSDGTAAGTVLVKDINAGNAGADSSSPTQLTNVGGTLFFRAFDGTDVELWKSDGTANGTVEVKDINATTGNSTPTELTDVNGTLFFQASDGTDTELWKSDGTRDGTVEVEDIFAGASSSFPHELTSSGGVVYFGAADGINGSELWVSDGTPDGTNLVEDINAGSNSNPTELTDVNGTLFFRAFDGTDVELWKSNGTQLGTEEILDIRPGSTSSTPTELANIDGTLFFRANEGVNGNEPWKSNGQASGTVLVKDINPLGISEPGLFTNVNGTAFFTAYKDGSTDNELWKSDGTAAGTVEVKDITPGAGGSHPDELTNVAGTLYFEAGDGTDSELWRSDGTAAGTVEVADINPGAGSSSPAELTNVNGTLFFRANDGTSGSELWMVPPPDTTAPETTIDSGPSGTTADSTPTFAFSATESGSTFDCSVDSGAFFPCASPYTTAPLGDGAHTFAVRARDAAGNSDPSPATSAFAVATESSGAGADTASPTATPITAPVVTSVLDTIAPALGALRLASARFRAARSGPSIAVTVGARVTYVLSEAAATRFRVDRALPGRKVGGRCVRPTTRNRTRAGCTRWITVRGSFTHGGAPGSNTFRFRGRVGGSTLKPGTYRLVARATDPAGNRSATRRVGFRIVR